MQKLFVEDTVRHPAEKVIDLMRDRLPEILPFLPNIDELDELEREDLDDGRVRARYFWQGNNKAAPKAIRPLVSKAAMAWTDEVFWAVDGSSVKWTITPARFAKLYECSGINFFEPAPGDPEGSSVIRMTGEISVYAERMPGLPKFLARKIGPLVERFVVKRVTPNLAAVVDGLREYLNG